MTTTTIVWFRRDLRIEDNPALAMASKDQHARVLPVFIWCPKEETQFHPGRVSRWWLNHSLAHLNHSLTSLGSPLLFINTDNTLAALLRCITATQATKLVFNRLYDPVSLVRDHTIQKQLVEMGINVQTFNGDLLFEPWDIHDNNGHAFTRFHHFWEKCMTLPIETTSLLPPWRLTPPQGTEGIQSSMLEELGLEYETEKQSNALLRRAWTPGWSNAEKILNEFINENLLDYSKNGMKVDDTTTSLLSPFLHFGEISVRKVYQSVRMKHFQWGKHGKPHAEDSIKLFLRSIGLREYSRYICFNFPFTHERSLLGNLKHYPWQTDETLFKSWRQGRTGYPLVDAGMRELWATGWIHNRTRVIVASFFVKCLLLPWTWGMKYFWDTLLDADLESDILGWQYVSGSLPDGHDLNRLDCPEVQGYRYDPNGEYVRHWIPELARMPTQWIHHPWDAPKSVLIAAGVELGTNYPKPIVEIAAAKARLDDAVSLMWELDRAAKKGSSDEHVADNLIDINIPDVPKVLVKKETTSVTSSFYDQKVPSFRPRDYGLVEQKTVLKDPGRSNQHDLQECYERTETSTIHEDLRSTAESSSSRKRSYSESQYAVPSFSTPEVKEASNAQRSSSSSWEHVHGNTGLIIKEKEDGETDTLSTMEDFKSHKKKSAAENVADL